MKIIRGRINDPAADDRLLGGGVGNFAFGAREIVAVGHDQVGELAGLYRFNDARKRSRASEYLRAASLR